MDGHPDFEWDDATAAYNLAEHGVAFEAIRRFDWDACLAAEDTRFDYGEPRFVSVGPSESGSMSPSGRPKPTGSG